MHLPPRTSADDGKLRTAKYDLDSPTNLLLKLEQNTVRRLPIGMKACARTSARTATATATTHGWMLASCYKCSMVEEEDEEEPRGI